MPQVHDPLSGEAARIVVADDMPENLDLFERLLEREHHVVLRANDGVAGLALAQAELPDLVLVDVQMPGMTGFEVCSRLKNDPATRLIPVVLITGMQGAADRLTGINAGADDFLSKPINGAELRARVRSLVRIKRYTDELEYAETTFLSLARTIEARDRSTEGHCQRLSHYATALGRALGLCDADLAALARGSVIHDIGKIGVPDAVLLKPGPLTSDEYAVMKDHTVIGDRLCSTLRSLQPVRPIVRHHHERYDGSGYPDGLRGDDIPLIAQIMGVVDVFDALTTVRPYKPALPVAEACRELEQEAAAGWRRPDLVSTFVALASTRGVLTGADDRRWALDGIPAGS